MLIPLLFCLLPTAPARASIGFVPAASVTDMVHDLKRNMLYVTGGGIVLRYDMSSGSFAAPWVLGGNLTGIAISPDDDTLVVGDLSVAGGQVWVHVIDVRDGVARKIVMPRSFGEAGTYSVSFGKDGKIYAASTTSGSGWQPFRQIDPGTDAWVDLLTVSDRTMLCASADGNVIAFAEGNISDGRFGTYTIETGELVHQTGYDLGTGAFNHEVAANKDGTGVAIPTYDGTFVYDRNLIKIGTLGRYAVEYAAGAAYNPITSDLYLSIAGSSIVYAYDGITLGVIAAYDFGAVFDRASGGNYFAGRLKTSRDGNVLFATVDGGVSYLPLGLAPQNAETSIASTENPAVHGDPVTFIATVSSVGGSPGGFVRFMDEDKLLGTAMLSGDPATARLTTALLKVATHTIRAVYEGDGNFKASTSPVLLQTVTRKSTLPVRMVPYEYEKIQEAINEAVAGDTVSVAPGAYRETINFLGKAITVASEAGAASTVIDGNGVRSVVTFSSGEGPEAVLQGFTIQNGHAQFDTGYSGGGIAVYNSSPTIIGNIITGNMASEGSGLSVDFGSPVIQGNTISYNMDYGTGGMGGGISIGGAGSAHVVDNVILGNRAYDGGGISLFAAGTPTITGNFIIDNYGSGRGGGISMYNYSDALIVDNVIAGNSAGQGGGVFWLVPSGCRGPVLVNNTIVDNDSQQGSGVYADGYDAAAELINNIIVARAGQIAVYCGNMNDLNPPVFRFNNVFSPSGSAYGGICTSQTGLGGNISIDPLFLNQTSGDYHLHAGSLAIDAGDNSVPALPAADLDDNSRMLDGDRNGGVTVDMGAYEFCGTDPIQNARSRARYTSVQAAYEDPDVTIDGDIFQIATAEILGPLNLDRGIAMTLDGGYNCEFLKRKGHSIILGSLTVCSGSVVIDGIVIQ